MIEKERNSLRFLSVLPSERRPPGAESLWFLIYLLRCPAAPAPSGAGTPALSLFYAIYILDNKLFRYIFAIVLCWSRY